MVEFRDPRPPVAGMARAHAIDAEVDELMTRPGQWALVRTNADHQNARPYKKRGCETTLRSHGDKFDIYARWPIGEDVLP